MLNKALVFAHDFFTWVWAMKGVLLSLILSLVSGVCYAQKPMLKTSMKWLKRALPENMQIDFSKSRINLSSGKYREYQLQFSHNLTDSLLLQGGIKYAKDKVNLTGHEQKISQKRFSLIPRVQLLQGVSVGAGVVFESEPEFRTSLGDTISLPKSQTWLLNTRFEGGREDHYIQVEFSNQRWQPDASTQWHAQGKDTKLNVSYQAHF